MRRICNSDVFFSTSKSYLAALVACVPSLYEERIFRNYFRILRGVVVLRIVPLKKIVNIYETGVFI